MAKKSNTLLYVGLGAAALFLFMRSKGAKLPFTSAGEDTEAEGEETPQKRGRVEVGPTETLSEQEFYGQPAASPISRLREKAQATAADVESIRETAEGLFTRRSGGGEFTSPADFAVKTAIQRARKARKKGSRAARLAKAKAAKAARLAARKARLAARKAKRKLRPRRLRRGKRLGELNFI